MTKPASAMKHPISTEAHLIDLETRIAHQDQAIHDLSTEIYQQQKQIEQLEATCKYLLGRSQLPSATDNLGDEKPPHY